MYNKSMDDMTQQLRDWLGADGIQFFREIKKKYGTVNAIWNEGGIPHSVHFREGMSVRNQLRRITDYSWTAHEYDDRWTALVEKAIEQGDL